MGKKSSIASRQSLASCKKRDLNQVSLERDLDRLLCPPLRFMILFSVLQIKLLQGAANAYTIERDARFAKWFESVLIMDERESFELSCQIEPIANGPANAAAAASSAGKESRFRRRITPTANHRQDNSTKAASSGVAVTSSTTMMNK